MQNEIIYENIPQEYYYKELGRGCNGICYLTKDKNVYKEYYEEINYLDTLKALSGYDSSIFMFPKKLIYLKEISKENLKGYTMNYASGCTFNELSDNIKIKKLIEDIKELEKEMAKLLYEGIIIKDLNPTNLIYNEENGIKVIDTDFYEVTYDDIYSYRRREATIDLASTIISRIITDECYNDNEISKLITKCGGYGQMSNYVLLQEIMKIVENRYGNINTLGEFKHCMTLTKK